MKQDPESKLRYSIPDGFQETAISNSKWRTLKHPNIEGHINFRFEDLSGGPGLDFSSEESLRQIGVTAKQQFQNVFEGFELMGRFGYSRDGEGLLVQRAATGLVEGAAGRAQMSLLLFPHSLVFVSANEPLLGGEMTELRVRSMEFLTSIQPESPTPQPTFLAPSKRLIFLSHNSKDKPEVCAIAKELQDAGFKVWLDKNDLALGDLFALEIDKALIESQVMVLILGEHGLGPWQATEYAFGVGKALNKKMTFIPFALSSTVEWPPLASTFNGIMPPADVDDLIARLKL